MASVSHGSESGSHGTATGSSVKATSINSITSKAQSIPVSKPAAIANQFKKGELEVRVLHGHTVCRQ